MPESPNEIQIEEMVYKLGNLTPLEPSFNRDIGNAAYSEKRKVYEQSVYQITSIIQAEQWTIDSINTRQEQFAKRAIHIWRADCAD